MKSMHPKGNNPNVSTPEAVAGHIVNHFMPSGICMDPCRGGGAFYRAMESCAEALLWCEISEGIDFLEWRGHVDWVVTNPPWGEAFTPILKHAMSVSDNVVFLCLVNAWFQKARWKAIREARFGIVEILEIPTPARPWPQTGFMLGAAWLRRGWNGGFKIL